MIRCIKNVTGILILASLLAACSSSGNKKQPGEPNNTIMKAGMLQSGKQYTMKIDSVGDIDWYAIAVGGRGYLNISTKEVPEKLELAVRFASKQPWKQQKQKWQTGWEKLPQIIQVNKADTIYFAIHDNYNDKSSSKNITFKADFIKEFDKYEPNNEIKDADSVSFGEVVKSAFFPKTDLEWYKIKVEKPGYLMTRARSVPDNLKLQVRYADKNSSFGETKYIKGWSGLPSGVRVDKAGEYALELKDDYNDAMSRQKAEWKVDFIAEMDSTEPNDTYDEAYQVAIGDTIKPRIFPKGDSDYFAISPQQGV